MGSGQRQERSCTYSELVYETYEKLRKIRSANHVVIDGGTLDIPSVVGVSRYTILVSHRYNVEPALTSISGRYDISPKLDESPDLSSRVNASVATLNRLLRQGQTIYGRSYPSDRTAISPKSGLWTLANAYPARTYWGSRYGHRF